jgi:hypothetical protein
MKAPATLLSLRTTTVARVHCYKSLGAKPNEIGLKWLTSYHCGHFWITNRWLFEEPIHPGPKAAGASTSEIERLENFLQFAARKVGTYLHNQ